MSETLDLKKEMKTFYAPSTKAPVLVDVPQLAFLMIDGEGNPNTDPRYQAAVQALFSLSYTLKFAIKKSRGIDYGVMPLEGLWWTANMADFSTDRKEEWLWTMMIAQPALVTGDDVEKARLEALKKKGLPLIEHIRFESFTEGPSVQLMHVGPYSAEAENIQRLHAYIKEIGCELTGRHHEIYLNQPDRTAPEKMKTVLRQPVRKIAA